MRTLHLLANFEDLILSKLGQKYYPDILKDSTPGRIAIKQQLCIRIIRFLTQIFLKCFGKGEILTLKMIYFEYSMLVIMNHFIIGCWLISGLSSVRSCKFLRRPVTWNRGQGQTSEQALVTFFTGCLHLSCHMQHMAKIFLVETVNYSKTTFLDADFCKNWLNREFVNKDLFLQFKITFTFFVHFLSNFQDWHK